jgi:Concanavalin A-like lectin/glucanases superfamily/Domain of unknown function (DUF1929)/Bacterial Ig domain/Galactose oxidase, central domain
MTISPTAHLFLSQYTLAKRLCGRLRVSKKPGRKAVVILVFAVCVVSLFRPYPLAQTASVITFDNPVPTGPPDSLLNGVFEGIDFGTAQWRWSGPYAADPTNSIYFDSTAVTSSSFAFSPVPRVLNRISVYATANGTLTLSDNVGQTVIQPVVTGSMQLVATGWSLASTTVTVSFTAGWSLGVDDIAHSAAGGPDATPPTVAITSPGAGATVSGTVTVTATASDNVGVAGVRFMVDGTNIGEEDTTEPYAISWNTTSTPNGSRVLRAIARDAGGNQAPSDPVTVTVSNVASPDPSQDGQWAGPIAWPLVAIHSMLMQTGQVLVWEGQENGGISARIWNPQTGAFTAARNNRSNLFCSGHSALADGRILVAGGHTAAFVGIRDTNIFDPVTQNWTQSTPMAVARWYPTTTTLPDGRVLALSGSIDCSTCIARIPEIYNPVTATWTQLNNATLTLPLYPYMFVLPNGQVLNAGADEAATVARALDTATGTWTTIDPVVVQGGSAAMFLPGRVMKSGRSANVDLPTVASVATTYVLDMTQPSPAWRQTASMAYPRAYHTLTVLPDGDVLVTGGGRTTGAADIAQAVYQAESWTPATETWTTMASMQVPRLYHSTALLLPDGRVLVAGGGRLAGGDQLNAEIFSPRYLFRGPRPTITSVPATIQLGSNFFVETPDASSIGMVSLVRPGSVTHTNNMDQRFLSLTFQQTAGGLNVAAPVNANLAPPGYYMLFVVNANGVPSMASFVRIPASSNNPVPTTTGITPSSAAPGGPEFTLTVNGTNFVTSSVVRWAGLDRTTTFVSSTQLTAAIPAIDIAAAGSAQVTVFNRAPGGGISNPQTFTISNAPSGLVAAYNFDAGSGTTVTDSSGNSNNGTITGATWTTSGRFGNALLFDGTNDWVTVNDAVSLDLTTGSTLEAWVYPTAALSGWRTIFAKEQPGDILYFLYAASSSSNSPATGVYIGAERNLFGVSQLASDTWTHLAGTYDGAMQRLYVNGVEVASRPQTGAIQTSDSPLRIGGNGIWGEFFQGRLDEMRIYSRALSQAEIQTDINSPVIP